MSEQTIFRNASPDKPYSVILNTALQDAELTAEAGWLLVFMLSQSRGWRFNVQHVIKHRRMGRDRVYKAISELCKRGYCHKASLRGKGGRTMGYEYQFTDEAGKFSAPLPEDQEMDQNPNKTAFPEPPETVVPDTVVQDTYKVTTGESNKREKVSSSKSASRELHTTEYPSFANRGRPTVLDEDWELPADWSEATKARHPRHADMIELEASRFRKFNLDKLTASDDWPALWSRWFDLAVNRAPGTQKARAIRDFDPGDAVHDTSRPFAEYMADCIKRGVYKPKTEGTAP